MPVLALWGARLVSVATGYALNDVTSFFSSGDSNVSTAVSNTIMLFAVLAVGLLSYLFIFKR